MRNADLELRPELSAAFLLRCQLAPVPACVWTLALQAASGCHSMQPWLPVGVPSGYQVPKRCRSPTQDEGQRISRRLAHVANEFKCGKIFGPHLICPIDESVDLEYLSASYSFAPFFVAEGNLFVREAMQTETHRQASPLLLNALTGIINADWHASKKGVVLNVNSNVAGNTAALPFHGRPLTRDTASYESHKRPEEA